MQRFIDSETVKSTLENAPYLDYLCSSVVDVLASMRSHLSSRAS